jgi:hypothetical protein
MRRDMSSSMQEPRTNRTCAPPHRRSFWSGQTFARHCGCRLEVAAIDCGARDYIEQDFVTLWKDADPDIPILRQAKAEYARLQ